MVFEKVQVEDLQNLQKQKTIIRHLVYDKTSI